MLSKYTPICVSCQQAMQSHKLGVLVLAYPNTPAECKFFADLKKCSTCGTEVLSGFGAPIYPYEEGYHELNNPEVTMT